MEISPHIALFKQSGLASSEGHVVPSVIISAQSLVSLARALECFHEKSHAETKVINLGGVYAGREATAQYIEKLLHTVQSR